MFNTKNIVSNVNDVPTTWIFEHFCKLSEKLNGNDVKIKSLFNPNERTPSMCIYLTDYNNYRYKDFSTGKNGSAVELVQELTGLTFYKAAELILKTYNKFITTNDYTLDEFQKVNRYKVSKYKLRDWNKFDESFWTSFNIGSQLLEDHNVKPLEHYKLSNDDCEFYVKGICIYGYFKQNGTLYKIYQPKNIEKKFIKVANYIQGYEQLNNNENLIITSSLKDLMSIKSLRLKIDVIAPHSENTMISPEVMSELIEKYRNVIIMFDYDDAGISSMKKYKELYPCIKTALLPMSKDVSDSIKDFGAREVRNRIVPILDKKLQDD